MYKPCTKENAIFFENEPSLIRYSLYNTIKVFFYVYKLAKAYLKISTNFFLHHTVSQILLRRNFNIKIPLVFLLVPDCINLHKIVTVNNYLLYLEIEIHISNFQLFKIITVWRTKHSFSIHISFNHKKLFYKNKNNKNKKNLTSNNNFFYLHNLYLLILETLYTHLIVIRNYFLVQEFFIIRL